MIRLIVILGLTGCARADRPLVGERGGACYRNGTCDLGLACEGGICVEPDGNRYYGTGDTGADCTVAPVWLTVDQYQAEAGVNMSASGMVEYPAGTLWVFGAEAIGADQTPWTTRQSTDRGGLWQTTDLYHFNGQDRLAVGRATVRNGRILVVGAGRTGSGDPSRWLVRATVDAGASWELLDEYRYVGTAPADAAEAVIDAAGNIYVVGTGADAADIDHWIVRKLTGGAGTWTTVDDFQCGDYAEAFTAIALGNDILVGGECYDGVSERWVVRRSLDGGSSWTTVDDFILATGQDETDVESLAHAGGGVVFAAGNAHDPEVSHWIVRRSLDAGDSWETVDDYRFQSGSSSNANAVAVDLNGVVYVAGDGSDGTSRWIVRRSLDGGDSWETVDEYQLATGENAEPLELAVDGTNDVYTLGWAADASRYWLVRKLGCD